LRSREEQYEATRQHAQAQTEILAQKSAELNDLRAQKAADDVSRMEMDIEWNRSTNDILINDTA
jgi:F0F1-type ATP synthase membrane subunit b/b'